jgi:hypothetical protein
MQTLLHHLIDSLSDVIAQSADASRAAYEDLFHALLLV